MKFFLKYVFLIANVKPKREVLQNKLPLHVDILKFVEAYASAFVKIY